MTLLATEIIAKRVFNPLYIYLDIVFLVALCALLVVRKKYLTLIFGLFGGIRSAGFESFGDKIMTLIVNSLLETNLGAVPIYCIYVFISARVNENLKKRDKVSFKERIKELNSIKIIPQA